MAMLKENNTRTGIVKVSYPQWGDTKEIEVNFDELNRKEAVKVDCINPSLRTQANYAIDGIESGKDRMLRAATQLLVFEDIGIVCTQLDSLYNYLARIHEEILESDCNMTPSEFSRVKNHAYALIESAKILVELYQSKECIDANVQKLEYAQKGVLI